MKKIIIYLPLFLTFCIFSVLLIHLLKDKNPSHPPSALLNQEIPNFAINDLFDDKIKLSNLDINKNVTIVNFFASWCAPCKIEHPLLMKLKEKYPDLVIIGIDYKDKKEDAINFLLSNGNPYNFVGFDENGNTGFEFGVFGLPETFIINKLGKIIYKHIGPLENDIIKKEIIPIL